ncbi:hypothetical protein [Pseudonocardia sp. N23]|uniref:hypothetical protein n=1 Tax=Pseudonocardia sp. N23 TaxID=1987376 RepID=UPI000BFDAB7F|nr:hypothetical protein [Pseudonocardia sp. N23]GAY12055.1 hypothetical protein TOK_0445 [Pseudonocardia sp. N23]
MKPPMQQLAERIALFSSVLLGLVMITGLWLAQSTGDQLWLLLVLPGAPIVALAVIGAAVMIWPPR